MDEILVEFLNETRDCLTVIDNDLVELERNPSSEDQLSNVFRMFHTIKGTSGFLELERLGRVTHHAETVLSEMRDGRLEANPNLFTTLFKAVDRVKEIVESLESTGQEGTGNDDQIVAALDQISQGQSAGSGIEPGPSVQPAPPAEGQQTNVTTSERQIVSEDKTPSVESPPQPVQTSESADAVATPVVKQPQAVPEEAPKSEAPAQSQQARSTLRIDVDRLESLMTLVGELVLTRNQLVQISRKDADSIYTSPLQRLSQITSELQEEVMKSRMQPIESAWSQLPRIARSLAVDLGKQIELKMHGSDTEIDRQVLDIIRDPLIHMVRNAADHGIETPAQRIASGKPPVGHISLEAYHQGGHIIIELTDDGKGLDLEAIRQKALSKGMATETELAGKPASQLLNYIFEAGFSTASEVTSVSGRGVGMDVVRSNIEQIGGTISVDSKYGHGTSFTFKIPLTLAIVAAMIVESCGERFAIPQHGIAELIRVGRHSEYKVERLNGTALIRLREQLLPVLSLRQLLTGKDVTESDYEENYAVVIQLGKTTLALTLERVFDTEEIVVKPLSPILRSLDAYSGNTILGDGRVAMILDLNHIASASHARVKKGQVQLAQEALESHHVSHTSGTSLLVFKGGDSTPKAVPLNLVTRIEEFDMATIERSAGQPVVQYREGLMPLINVIADADVPTEGVRPVLVFSDTSATMGMVVDEIVDICEYELETVDFFENTAVLTSVIVDHVTTDLINIAYYVDRVFGGWFKRQHKHHHRHKHHHSRKKSLLLVDDSPFVRSMVGPLLQGRGFHVRSVESARAALSLREQGAKFDLIISDIEMPDMSGHDFALECRRAGEWIDTPIIALTSHSAPSEIERTKQSGFNAFIEKFDQDTLIKQITVIVNDNLEKVAS